MRDEEHEDNDDRAEKAYRVNVGKAVARRTRVRIPEGHMITSPNVALEKEEKMMEEVEPITRSMTRSQ